MATAQPLPLAAATPGQPAIGTGGGIPAEGDSGGYRIVIAMSAAGDLSVGLEGDSPATSEAAEPGMDTAQETLEGAMKPCADIKAALTEALRLYKANGADVASERDFQAGFGGA